MWRYWRIVDPRKAIIGVGLLIAFVSTSIHLIQSTVQQLIDFFPDQGFSPADIAEFNRQNRFHFERIRDFIILHYHLNQRTDSPFWQACAAMAVPDSLREKLALYKARGRVVRIDNELFSEVGWLQVMQGQNLVPDGYHPLVDLQPEDNIHDYLESVREVIAKCVQVMPVATSGTPASTACRMAAGFSVRGLSSVTITRSARWLAIAPMIGRLPGSRSPPQPKITISLPRTAGRSAWSACSSASGLWA
jgi:hypothetical protein